jgi:hypothetical protein
MYRFHPGRIQPTKIKTKLKKTKKQNTTNTPSNPSLVQAFQIMLSGINEPPFPGKIRMLVKKDLPSYLSLDLYSYDKSLTEWQTLFESYATIKIFTQREIGLDEQYNPFFHSKATGVLLRKEYEQQMKLRWLSQKWIQRVRNRLYQRRLVGETDLRTLEPIAKKDAVQVFCHTTKSVYQFHIHSIIRMIRENLYYEQWGRADPMEPRNPYTNQSWSLHQLIEIIHQIQTLAVARRETIPSFLARFVEARYSVKNFLNRYHLELGINATNRFFQTPESRIVRSEVLHQLFEQINKLHKTSLYRSIQQKRCPSLLQNGWELLIHDKWIHDNYGYSPRYMWRDIMEQTITIQRLYQQSLQWHTSQMASVVLVSFQEPPLSEESDGADSF